MALTRAVTLELTIGLVSIEGCGPRNAFRLKLSLERELSRLLGERGLPAGWASGSAPPVVRTDGFRWDGRGGDEGLAAALARHLYEGFER